jgi:ribosome-binding factor A
VVSPRVLKVKEAVRKEISDIVAQMKDPRIGLASITDVDISKDLRHVKVYVSVYGDDSTKESTIEALQIAKGYIRTELGQRVRLRYVPEIAIALDSSIEKGARINELLGQISSNSVPDQLDIKKLLQD